jgi:cell division protein FtsZ
MMEELKVTVVATGLGSEVSRAPLKVVETSEPVQVDTEPDYKALEQPAIRRKRDDAGAGRSSMTPPADANEDYFDIPAFLRRQAD